MKRRSRPVTEFVASKIAKTAALDPKDLRASNPLDATALQQAGSAGSSAVRPAARVASSSGLLFAHAPNRSPYPPPPKSFPSRPHASSTAKPQSLQAFFSIRPSNGLQSAPPSPPSTTSNDGNKSTLVPKGIPDRPKPPSPVNGVAAVATGVEKILNTKPAVQANFVKAATCTNSLPFAVGPCPPISAEEEVDDNPDAVFPDGDVILAHGSLARTQEEDDEAEFERYMRRGGYVSDLIGGTVGDGNASRAGGDPSTSRSFKTFPMPNIPIFLQPFLAHIRSQARLGHGYVIRKKGLRPDALHALKSAMIIRPGKSYSGNPQDEIPWPFYRETPKHIVCPRFYGQLVFGVPDRIVHSPGDGAIDDNLRFSATEKLINDYPPQVHATQCVVKEWQSNGGGLLGLPCGLGKTASSIWCASEGVRQADGHAGKILVIVQQDRLMHQFAKSINRFLPNARVKKMKGQSQLDFSDCDVVVAMEQTLVPRLDPDYHGPGGMTSLKRQRQAREALEGKRPGGVRAPPKKSAKVASRKPAQATASSSSVAHQSAANLMASKGVPLAADAEDDEDEDALVAWDDDDSAPNRWKFWSQFRTVIVDEFHHAGTMLFTKLLSSFNCRYFLGLTATPEGRGDGNVASLLYNGGQIAFRMRRDPSRDNLSIFMVRMNSQLKGFPDGKIDSVFQRAKAKGILARDFYRNRIFARIIVKMFRQGRMLFALAERRQQILIEEGARSCVPLMIRELDEEAYQACGFLVGGMKPEEQERALEKPIVFATVQMAEEALDDPKRETMVYLSDKNGAKFLEQSIGRIVRLHERKNTWKPFLVDIWEQGKESLRGGGYVRKRIYEMFGYEVTVKEWEEIKTKF